MCSSRNVGVALVGLLVVAAISVAAGSGRKPAKELGATASLRRLSGSEVMDILSKFPEMVPDHLAAKKNDAAYLTGVFQFSEVTEARLVRLFPAARFYKGFDITILPQIPYLMAVVGDKRYMMPAEFNRLLIDNDLQVTDKNMVELAKAFVVLAAGNQGAGLLSFPQITFLDAKRTGEYDARLPVATDVVVRCRIDTGEVQTWEFSQSRTPREGKWVKDGQFATALLIIGGKHVRIYRPVRAVDETRRGESGGVPQVEIAVDSGNATVESDGTYDHYYLETCLDGAPTNDWVRFRLHGFDSSEAYVYVRVYPEEPYTYGPDTLLGPIVIDGNGEGALDWTPSSGTRTGMGVVCAGKMPPGDTFSQRTSILDNTELTLEKVITGQFPSGGNPILKVHFCHQFFEYHDSLEGHAPVFVQRVKDAMLESWRMQVDTWGLGIPPDADNIHKVFVNDGLNWYHGPALQAGYARSGSNRRIGVPSSIWAIFHEYTTEDSIVRSAIAHEFYHGIQWGLSSDKWEHSEWRWFSEAQAVFIQSVQCDSEEFKKTGGLRQYPENADILLANHLNTSLVSLSNDTLLDLRGYPYCLFWRCMFEKYDSTGIADGVRFVRNCYAETVGTSNSIGRGKAAINAAMVKSPVFPGWANFSQVLDQFAVACYLNDTSFHRWHDPHGVYSRPHLTVGTDTAFRVGPNETDTIGFTDSIPHSFGIDLMQVALDTIVDTVRVTLARPTNETLTLSARLVKVYRKDFSTPDTMVVPPIGIGSDSSTRWDTFMLRTQNVVRLCLVVTRQDTLDNSGCVDTAKFWVKRAVAVTKLLPRATDTLMAGTPFTPRAVVVNRGWMKESLYVRFRIGADSVYSDSQPVTLSPGHTDTVVFREWTAKEGPYNTCCWVYLKSDSTRSDDTLHGFLYVLPESDDYWRLNFDRWNQDMAQPCSDSGMQSGGGGRIRHQWICCWHQTLADSPPWSENSTDYACLSWQETTSTTWDTMISPRINLAGCDGCQLLQPVYCTLDSTQGTMQVLVSGDDGDTWHVVRSRSGVTCDSIDISQWADSSRDVRIAWVYDGPVQYQKAWCVDDVGIRATPARSCDAAVNGIAYPCGAITYGTSIVPRAYVVNHGVQSESLLVHMYIDGNSAQAYAWLAPHADTLVEFPAQWLAPDTYTMTCYVELPNDSDECRANDTAAMSFSVVADTWMPKFPVYNGEGMRSGAAIVAVDSEKLFCAPGNGTPTNGRAFAKYLVAEDLWKSRRTTVWKFQIGSAIAYPGTGDFIYALQGKNHGRFCRYSISGDRWYELDTVPYKVGAGAGLACLNTDSVYALVGSNRYGRRLYRYNVATHQWLRKADAPHPIGEGGRLVSSEGYLYAFRGGGKNDFYKYFPGADSWHTLAPTPESVKTGAAMACDPAGLIYAFFGGNSNDYDSAFYVYDGIQWLPRHRTPVATRSGGCITYANHSVYGGVGIGGSHRFWRYSPPCGGFLEAGGPQGWTGPVAAPLPAKSLVSGDRLDPGEQLTFDPSDKETPQYSPDGLWIAYTACDTASDVAGLYRISAFGGPPDTLGSDGVTYEDPRWSHSHSWLVAAADDGIYKVVGGLAPFRLAAGTAAGPCVTPDDSWVLYEAFDNTEHRHQVRRVRFDGTHDTCLTPGTDEYLEPRPISNSQFACARLKNDVYQLVKRSGGVETWLTSDYAENTCINVSPDGQWLSYQKLDESGFWQIYKMRVNGTEETRVTDGTCNCETPVFSPDGSYIAYTKWPLQPNGGPEYSQVCYKDTNTVTPEVPLNNPDAVRENPCWSPDCQYIIYELTTESGTQALASGHKKQLKQIGRARTHIRYHGDGVEGLSVVPRTFALYQNRPNPFGRNTTIRYALPVSSPTELSIYDVTGRTVTRLVQSEQKPGYYSVAWKGTDARGRSVAAGTYFYVLKSNGKIAQKRMLLVR